MASGSGSNQDPVKNIVLVGPTGNGKSATGNSLLGTTAFKSATQAAGVTTKCQTYRAAIKNGPIINVIDTPGMFDLVAKPEEVSKEIVSCLSLTEEGIHAVVFVLTVRTRLSQEEEDTLWKLQSLFGAKILDYLIVLYTGGDDLESQNITLADYFNDGVPEFMQRVLRLCRGRQVLFNNKTTDNAKKEKQVKELLAKVSEIEKLNKGKPFTDERHRQITAETTWFRQMRREVESRNHTEQNLRAMKMQLQKQHDQNLTKFAKMVETALARINQAPPAIRCNIL